MRNLKALLAALLIATPLLSSCNEATPPITAVETVQPQQDLIGDLLELAGGVIDHLIGGTDANGPDASAWIGPAGGTVSTAAYTLIVPANAVSKNTLFKIEPTNTGYYIVDLHAYQKGGLLNLSLIDVGSKGFLKPVTLRMSYANATNVEDPQDLLIVYVSSGGVEVKTSVVNTTTKTVSASLDHFSKYAMATD